MYRSFFFFFSSRRRHTRCLSDWSSDVCSSDLDQVKTAITAALASLLQNVSLIVGYVAILIGLSWRLTLVALVCAPLLVLIVRPMVGKVRRRSREQADQRGELTSLVSELVASIKLVRAYVAERFEADRFRKLADRYRRGVLRAQRYALLTRSEEHTSELQSLRHLVCRLLLEKKKKKPKGKRSWRQNRTRQNAERSGTPEESRAR